MLHMMVDGGGEKAGTENGGTTGASTLFVTKKINTKD